MNKTICNDDFNKNQLKNYKAEGEEIIMKLKDKRSGAMYSYQFFFDTDVTDNTGKKKKKLCQIAPLRSKIIYDIKCVYNIDVNPDDVSTIIYQTLWAGGSWKPLNSFEGRSSFFAWLKTVANNAVIEWLVTEHVIEDIHSRTPGNTRLALLSQAPSKCMTVINELMADSQYHELLTAIYVERLPKDVIMKHFNMNEVEYEVDKKAGEKKLKEVLLRSEDFSEENLVRDKKKHVVMVSSEFVADMAEWCKSKMGINPFSDVFGTDLTDEDVHQKVVEFLYDFSAKLNWSDEDRYIWRQRFMENVAPVEVARKVGRSRAWLDTRYSRINAKFRKAIQKWWKSHAE